MTKEEAYRYIDNLKWLKGYDNTTIDGKTVGEILDDIKTLLKEQDNCENCAIAIEDRQLVTRCKNCKYGYMLPNSSDYVHCTKPYSGTISHKPDWFCADGKRRDSDG